MRSRPLIFQYARSLNYRTHLLGGTDQLERLGRSSRDFRYVDDYRRLAAFGDNPDTDFRIAEVVSDLLDEPVGQFIVVFKRGNHFPYRINYPSPGDVWPPADKGAGSEAEPPAFADTYDRGLRYNLDTFFRILLRPDGSRARTVILYTSDHGDGLDYNGTGWRAFGWETFAVPLLMLGDDRPVVDTRYRASHHNIFATLLDLMGFPSDRRPSGYGRSLLQARLQDIDRRPVFRGDLWGDDAFQTQDFDTMRPADMARRNQ
jgi:arylsulfatase A-like enzyme